MDDSACYHSAWAFDAACRCEAVDDAQYCMCSHPLCCVSTQISSGNYPDHADRIQGRGSGGCADDQWRWPAIDEEGFDDCLYDIYLFRDFQWHRNAGWHNGICKNNLSKDGKIFMYRAAFCCQDRLPCSRPEESAAGPEAGHVLPV